MEKIDIILITLAFITFVIFLIIVIKSEIKIKKIKEEYEKNNQLTFEYLETVRKRANLSSSMDALQLLYDEVAESPKKFTYSGSNYEKAIGLKKYIHGKYKGIESTKIKKNENI